MAPKSKFTMSDSFNLITPSKDFKSYKNSSSSSSAPPMSSGSGSGQKSALPAITVPSSSSAAAPPPPPPPQAAVPVAPLSAHVPGLASHEVDLRPADPMDTSPDYEGFGYLGSRQAAWVYQMIIYPALCRTYGGVDPSVIPAYAHYL